MPKGDYEKREYTEATLAYLAGIIDGEGSIYIGNFSSNPKTGAKYYQTNMEITNTSKPLMDWLMNTFGGLLNKYTEKQSPKNHRQEYWRWIATGDRLTHLCELILPYLICKKRQCEIMLKMRATYIGNGKGLSHLGKSGVQPHTQELLDYRQSLMDEIRSLHVRNYLNKEH
uniref:Homing endonuclease, LAGLIDADG n=1 Tax=uncultured Caudovirales phage TaxID=2100421 RepID=A0A6J5L1R4_9CAUD|nr:Homing endonuclease, LAGLIDADG [uncultured Caudovirales phage]